MKLTIKMFLFVSAFVFLGISTSFGQSSNFEIIKGKLSEVTAEAQPSSSATTLQNGVVPSVPVAGYSLEVLFYQNLLKDLESKSPATALQDTYRYVSKNGANPKVLTYRIEAASLLNL